MPGPAGRPRRGDAETLGVAGAAGDEQGVAVTSVAGAVPSPVPLSAPASPSTSCGAPHSPRFGWHGSGTALAPQILAP